MEVVEPLTKRHQGEVCHGAVPHRHLDHVRRRVRVTGGYVDLFGLAGDLLYGAHEQVGDDGDPEKAGEKSSLLLNKSVNSCIHEIVSVPLFMIKP